MSERYTCQVCGLPSFEVWAPYPRNKRKYRCDDCMYNLYRTKFIRRGNVCSKCKTTITSCWHTSTVDVCATWCNRCYHRYYSLLKNPDKPKHECEECGESKSRRWFTAPSGKKRSWCSRCYRRNLRQRKKNGQSTKKRRTQICLGGELSL